MRRPGTPPSHKNPPPHLPSLPRNENPELQRPQFTCPVPSSGDPTTPSTAPPPPLRRRPAPPRQSPPHVRGHRCCEAPTPTSPHPRHPTAFLPLVPFPAAPIPHPPAPTEGGGGVGRAPRATWGGNRAADSRERRGRQGLSGSSGAQPAPPKPPVPPPSPPPPVLTQPPLSCYFLPKFLGCPQPPHSPLNALFQPLLCPDQQNETPPTPPLGFCPPLPCCGL